ncbi:hypothetical protein HETIRDRAFT_145810 [Heterobasidion irregulare TC 32-1]|uniref:Uncharacterized protein n=1 Tax=Heterobasidion irregulare (strain TC 32-1) TaxID=747525 RepID=W4KJR5_HETIT|nr:uncharacterized protein HETIRDRAFT_145810 [Heterobasidion irregulare TC 32-1]ETW85944.1 hypothetical protein HETIRDRAFT_145810 [Heterobasidion irregulare TC 32-1]
MGAGDEVDYVTPDKGRNGKGAEGHEAKRVKWDRGLFDTVYLDDIKPGTQGTSLKAAVVTQKGALSATAKSLQLDSYGNLLADSPLKDLVPENITVKKFVYDDDVEAHEIPKPKTRSKKSKS